LESQSPKAACERMVEEIRSIMNFPIVVLETRDASQNEMQVQGMTGIIPDTGEEGMDLMLIRTLSTLVARTGQPLIEADVPGKVKAVAQVPAHSQIWTYVGMPLVFNKEVIGILSLAHLQ